jgi:Protein of unknown function (DUF2950)
MRTTRKNMSRGKRDGNVNVKEVSRMDTQDRWSKVRSLESVPWVLLLTVLFACALCGSPIVHAQTNAAANQSTPATGQETFSTPEDASQALVAAAKAMDRVALAKIFGPEYDQLLSGDAVEDDKDLKDFAEGLEDSAQLRKDSDAKYTLLVGKNSWPSPIPIVKRGNEWLFDTKAGLVEVLNRRIGDNELSAIATCRAYAVAQWEYFTEGDHDNDGVAEYAQKFMSSPGQRDGLYWPTRADEKPSPFGELVAEARAEGYGPKAKTNMKNAKAEGSAGQPEEKSAQRPRHPYHGYYFKILTGQGPSAPGGQYNYIINGNMIAGFALVAYPAKWGNSGVMTFILNQQGRVYQKNLGSETDKIASAMTDYNPDPSWQLVQP